MNISKFYFYCFFALLLTMVGCASDPKISESDSQEFVQDVDKPSTDKKIEASSEELAKQENTPSAVSDNIVEDNTAAEEETKAKLLAAELEKKKELEDEARKKRREKRRKRRKEREERRRKEKAKQAKEAKIAAAAEAERKKKEAELAAIDPELRDIVAPQSKGGQPIVRFKETEFNFGRINHGEKVVHEFVFTNVGSAPLVIEDVQATCGCTMPFYPFVAIEPGKSDKIQVQFNSKGRLGSQNPIVTITTNAEPRTYELSLKGVVDTRE